MSEMNSRSEEATDPGASCGACLLDMSVAEAARATDARDGQHTTDARIIGDNLYIANYLLAAICRLLFTV